MLALPELVVEVVVESLPESEDEDVLGVEGATLVAAGAATGAGTRLWC